MSDPSGFILVVSYPGTESTKLEKWVLPWAPEAALSNRWSETGALPRERGSLAAAQRKESWYRQPCCQGRAIAETSLSHDSKWWCSQLTAGKCSEKGASDSQKLPWHWTWIMDMTKPKPTSQSPRLMGNRMAPMYLDHTTEVSVVSPASALHVLRRGCSPLQMGRHRTCPLCPPWGWASLVLTRLLGSCPAWFWCPRSQTYGSACLSQVRNIGCL